MDKRTRKLMTMHKALHPWNDADRQYVSRKRGEEDLPALKTALTHRYNKGYIEGKGLITASRNINDNTKPNRTIITRKTWEEKQLYVRFKRLISDISLEETWTWLKKENLKRETVSLLIARQNNAIRTNHIKAR